MTEASGLEKLDADDGKYPMKCHKCEEECKASAFLLTNASDTSWAGQYHGSCFKCGSEKHESEESFKKRCKAEWKKVAKIYGKRRVQARDLTFRELRASVLEVMPLAAHKEIREACADRLKALVLAFTASILKDAKYAQMSKAILDRYHMELNWSCMDVRHAGAHQGWTLNARDASNLTWINEYVLVPFMCRTCYWYGMNDQWIQKRDGKYAFRCPACLTAYRPWSSDGGRHPANKCVGVGNPVTLDFSFFPAVWAPTQADSWLAAQAEAYARRTAMPDEPLEAFMRGSVCHLSALLRNIAPPAVFTQWQLPSDVSFRISESDWDYSRHREQGFFGQRLTSLADNPDLPLFTQWDLLIALVGRVTMSGMAASTSSL